MFAREILPNPLPEFQHAHCASIAVSSEQDIVVAWYAYPTSETRDAILMLTHKRPGAYRFEHPKRMLEQWNSSLGNPCLFFDSLNRLQLLFVSLPGHYWDTAELYGCHSSDLGRSWSMPTSLRMPPGTMVRHPPILRSNLTYLLPAYDEKSNHNVLLSADCEASAWTELCRFSQSQAIQGCLVRRAPQQLTLMLRPCGDDRVCLRSISSDDGRSWCDPLRTTLPNPLSGLAAFAIGQTLCTVYNHTTDHQRYPLSLATSDDWGVSWSEPKHLDLTPPEVSYPAFVVDENDVAHGVYTLGRSRICYITFDRVWWEQ